MKTKKLLKASFFTLSLALLFTTSAKAFTAVSNGNWSSAATWGGIAPGGSVSGQDITIPSGITVTLDMDVIFTGVINNFTVNGILSSSTTNSLTIGQGTLTGSGMISIHSIAFTSALSGMTYTGTLAVDKFKNSGASLILGAVITIQDTLNLDAGTLLLNAGANVTVLTNSTIKVNNGSITIGSGIFNSSSNHHIVYVGSSKTTGIELNSTNLEDVYVMLTNNTQTLTLGSNLTINNDLHHSSGKIDFSGRTLVMGGDLINGAGVTLISSSSSNLTMQGSTPPLQGLEFDPGAMVNNFTINYSGAGSARLTSDLTVTGDLNLQAGDLSLEMSSNLIMGSGSTVVVTNGTVTETSGTFDGIASYNVLYQGGSYSSGAELTKSGLNNVDISLTSSSADVKLTQNATIDGYLHMNNGKFNLFGKNLILNGTLDNNESANFIGNASSEMELHLSAVSNDTLFLDTSNVKLSKLVLDIPSGSTLVLGEDITIFNELNMQNGKLDLDDYSLTIQPAASINNYSDTRYIVTSNTGSLHMNVNASGPYTIFPVGTYTNYSPASVKQNSGGTTGFFFVRVFDGVLVNGTWGYNSADVTSVVDRTWIIDAHSLVTVNSDIKLGWQVASEVNGFDRTNAYISHFGGATWDSSTSSAAIAGAFSTYEITRTSLTTLSPFSVADINSTLLVNEIEKTAGLNIYPNPTNQFINIEMVNSTDGFKYELIDVTGRTINSTKNNNTRNSFDVSEFNNGLYFIKATNLNSKEIITKRFIKN